jgi:hypothetical protein
MKIGIHIHIPSMVWKLPGGGGETFRILQEDGSLILQEDGTSAILTEAA